MAAPEERSTALWNDSVSERLSAARSLGKVELDSLQRELCRECPVEPWPYGNATTVNPPADYAWRVPRRIAEPGRWWGRNTRATASGRETPAHGL